jgi:hypothetical protein
MKFNIEVDCTPEEVRRLVGLPDMAPVHEVLVAQMQDTVKNGIAPEMMMTMLKSWSPIGDTGMKFWQGLIDQVTNPRKT